MAAALPQIMVRTGTGEPASMALPPGEALGPLSIGREGTWRVVAPGVLEEHAFLYFNGTELFLQSADPNSPATVNGSPIPGSWTAVYAPCEIAFGGARLWFGPPGEAARPRPPPVPSRPPPGPSRPPPAASRPPPGPSAPPLPMPSVPRVHEMPSMEESTRQVSIEEIQQSARRPPSAVVATLKSASAPPPSFGAPPVFDPFTLPGPSAAPSPSFGAPPPSAFEPLTIRGGPPAAAPSTMGPGPSFGAPPPSIGALPIGAPPIGAPLTFGPGEAPSSLGAPVTMGPQAGPSAEKSSKIGLMWREASTPKKAMMVLMLPLIWAVWVIFTDKPPAPRPANPASSAATAPSSTPSAGAPTAGAPTAGSPTAGSPTSPAAGPVVIPTPAPTGSASGKPGDPRTHNAKTREREAADAVAVGAYAKAADIYDELAKAHPEVGVYGQAARIMRAKARR